MTATRASEPAAPASVAASSHWPKAAASAVVLRGNEVLLTERGKDAHPGIWSLPGGHIEPGETAKDAARREVKEETGLDINILGLTDVHDVIIRARDGSLRAHYLLAVFYATSGPGTPVAATDCRSARFVPIGAIADYTLTPGAERVIHAAVALAASAERNDVVPQ